MAAPGRGRHVSTHTMSREKGQTAAGVGVTVLSAFVSTIHSKDERHQAM